MRQFLQVTLHIYALSLLVSMAGMEAMSSLIAVVVWAGVLIGLKYAKFQKIPLVKPPYAWALWCFWAVIIAGALFITSLPHSLTLEVIGEGRWVMVFFAWISVLTLLRDTQPRLILFMAGSALVLAIYSFYQSRTGLDLFRHRYFAPDTYAGMEIWRVKGFFSNTMSYSYSLGTLFCLLLATILTNAFHGRARGLVIAATTAVGISLLLTFTRGAWVALAASVALMLVMWNRKRGLQILGGLVALLLVAVVVSEPVRERVASIYQEKQGSTSVSQRWDLWRANWAMFKDNPLLGVGYGENSTRVQEYHIKLMGHEGFVENAHNNVLQVLGGGGIFAFIFWVIYCVGFFAWAFRLWFAEMGKNPRPAGSSTSWAATIALGSIGAQLFFHIGGLTQATFFDNEPLYMFLFGLALLFSQKGGSRIEN